MPTTLKITKDKILYAAFEITRESGIENVSNRELAKKLNSSIRPIYYQFKNVEELNSELYKKIEKYFYKFLLDNMVNDIPPYKQVGLNYIKFAKEEQNLFKVLFMTNSNSTLKKYDLSDDNFKKILNLIKISTKLSDEDIESFHTKMWIFSHGLATLVANNIINLSDKQIKDLLTNEFQALMLLEKNRL